MGNKKKFVFPTEEVMLAHRSLHGVQLFGAAFTNNYNNASAHSIGKGKIAPLLKAWLKPKKSSWVEENPPSLQEITGLTNLKSHEYCSEKTSQMKGAVTYLSPTPILDWLPSYQAPQNLRIQGLSWKQGYLSGKTPGTHLNIVNRSINRNFCSGRALVTAHSRYAAL